jgi:pimeloyl-ACP methyl ester carboxylesterase
MTPAIEPRVRTVDGLEIRYAESGPGASDALLFNPWPESLYAYAPTWSRLAERAHLVAVDLPGFGHSEGRDDLMSPRAMGDFMLRVADAFGVEHPHVVGPDIGTSAALFAAAAQPGRLRSIVIGSGGAAYPLALSGRLDEWVRAPDVDGLRAVGGRAIVTATLQTITGYAMPDAIAEDYLSAYEGERFADSTRYVRAYPEDLRDLGDLLGGIDTPVLIVTGARDPAVPVVNGEYLHERLPNSRHAIVDTGHFVWEMAPEEYASLVTDWWARAPARDDTRARHGRDEPEPTGA